MAFTKTTVRNSVRACIALYYKDFIEKQELGRCTEYEMNVLKKLKVIHNLSLWIDFTDDEYEKVFCFISECEHKK